MSDAIAFDTHRFVKRLTDGGFTEKQAEILAEEQVSLLNANLATKIDIERLRQETKADIFGLKADIERLRQETKADIEGLRQETKADIATLKSELIKWLFGALIAQTGILAALLRLLG